MIRHEMTEEISTSSGRTAPTDVKTEGDRKEDRRDDDEKCLLQEFTRCSESHMWNLMINFYERKGIESWSRGIVPHFITCNSFIGRVYAKILYGFFRDCTSGCNDFKLDHNHPFYVVELGAGSGKFGFYMLKELLAMKKTCAFPVNKIVYVLTDITESNVKFWGGHPALQPFIQSGLLDMAIFDSNGMESLTLIKSGDVLTPGNVKNPMCFIANYLFDTLPHDIFQVENGELKEGLISVASTRSVEPDPNDPDIISRSSNSFMYRNVTDDYYRSEGNDAPIYKQMLSWYRREFSQSKQGASFLFPIGALKTIQKIMHLSTNGSLLLSGDKGNNRVDQFRGVRDPHIAVHGSFSMMVNFHAIGLYYQFNGGSYLHSKSEDTSLKVSAFVSKPEMLTSFDKSSHGGDCGVSTSRKECRDYESSLYDIDNDCNVIALLDDWTDLTSLVDFENQPKSKCSARGKSNINKTFETAEKDRSHFNMNENVLFLGNPLEIIEDYHSCSNTPKESSEPQISKSIDYLYPHFCDAFDEYVNHFGPNEFFNLQKLLKEDVQSVSLPLVINVLRLSNWDADIFYKFKDVFLDEANRCGRNIDDEVKECISKVWNNYFLLDQEKDVAFEIGRFYYGIRQYSEALKFYAYSTDSVGPHHITYHNMGLCYYSLGNLTLSVDKFTDALEVNQHYEKSKSWKKRVEDEQKKLNESVTKK